MIDAAKKRCDVLPRMSICRFPTANLTHLNLRCRCWNDLNFHLRGFCTNCFTILGPFFGLSKSENYGPKFSLSATGFLRTVDRTSRMPPFCPSIAVHPPFCMSTAIRSRPASRRPATPGRSLRHAPCCRRFSLSKIARCSQAADSCYSPCGRAKNIR